MSETTGQKLPLPERIILVPAGPSCGCDFCKEFYGINLIGWAKRIRRKVRILRRSLAAEEKQ